MSKIYTALTLLGSIFVLTAGPTAADEKSLTYHSYPSEEAAGEVVAKTTVQMKDISKDETTITRQKETQDKVVNDEFVLDEDYSLKTWTRVSEGDDTDITSERLGTKLVVKGKLKGEVVDKEIDLGNQSLYVYPEYNLSKFAMSDMPKMKFWTLRRDKMDKLPMQAKKNGEGIIIVNGQEVDVIKVYYSITGKLREKHYNHNYYYRKSDGLFVKKEENKGQIEELIKEK